MTRPLQKKRFRPGKMRHRRTRFISLSGGRSLGKGIPPTETAVGGREGARCALTVDCISGGGWLCCSGLTTTPAEDVWPCLFTSIMSIRLESVQSTREERWIRAVTHIRLRRLPFARECGGGHVNLLTERVVVLLRRRNRVSRLGRPKCTLPRGVGQCHLDGVPGPIGHCHGIHHNRLWHRVRVVRRRKVIVSIVRLRTSLQVE